jgi:hypothetical protein
MLPRAGGRLGQGHSPFHLRENVSRADEGLVDQIAHASSLTTFMPTRSRTLSSSRTRGSTRRSTRATTTRCRRRSRSPPTRSRTRSLLNVEGGSAESAGAPALEKRGRRRPACVWPNTTSPATRSRRTTSGLRPRPGCVFGGDAAGLLFGARPPGVVRRVELGLPTEQPSDDGAQEPLRTWRAVPRASVRRETDQRLLDVPMSRRPRSFRPR